MNVLKVVVVTGGTRGIGFATAKMLVERGFSVVFCGRDKQEVAAAEKQLGSNSFGVVADVSKSDDCVNLFKKAVAKFGKVDFLVNNAGVGLYKSIKDSSFDELKRVIDVNVTGTLNCSKLAAEHIGSGLGAIVNISSTWGKIGAANASAYCGSKFAVIGLSKALAAELYPKIKVFVVCPGPIDTDMLRKDFAYKGKAISPDKIASAVLDLVENYKERDAGLIVDVLR